MLRFSHNHPHKQILLVNTLKREFHVNLIQQFSSYLEENFMPFYDKHQSVNGVRKIVFVYS
jgi:galactose-1-phosphate uridylyltransferase